MTSTWLLLVVTLLGHITRIVAQDDSVLPASIPTLAISAIPAILTLPPLNASHPLLELTIPALASTYISINLCSLPSGWNASSAGVPTILVSRDAESGADERDTVDRWAFQRSGAGSRDGDSGGTEEGGPNRRSAARDGGGELWRLQWDKGFANWTYIGEGGATAGTRMLLGIGLTTDGSVRAVEEDGNVVVQIAVGGNEPLHTLASKPPFVADTTSNTALIFSALLGDTSSLLPQPVYPNYTIPSLPSAPPLNESLGGDVSSFNVIVVPTDQSPNAQGLDNSLCAARRASNSTGNLARTENMAMNRTEPMWTRIGPDGPGYRIAWGVGGLQSGTNYTVWTEQSGKLSGPSWFVSKSAECPGLSYAAPLPLDTSNINDGNSNIISSVPNTTSSILSSNLASFRTSLLSIACGRDKYSHVSTCLDCHEAYRDWLCRMLLPRCADPGPSGNVSGIYDPSGAPIPPAIIQRTPEPASSSLGIQGLGLSPEVEQDGMSELAPCLSTCHAVERQCPAFLKFRCPHYSNGASRRYGFHGDRSKSGNGDWGNEVPGMDKWGGAWCAL